LKGWATLAAWPPQCDQASLGLSFTDGNDTATGPEPRERVKWVEFHEPIYEAEGATIGTSQMVGPLAGTGYSCRLRSGIAGWTVSKCKTIWVS
jgi:hypothetical protein